MIYQFCPWAIYPDKTIIQKDKCTHVPFTPLFIAVLVTVIKTWKQMSIDRGMNEEDEVHIYSRIIFSRKKRMK